MTDRTSKTETLYLATDGKGNPATGFVGRLYRTRKQAEQSMLLDEHVEPFPDETSGEHP